MTAGRRLALLVVTLLITACAAERDAATPPRAAERGAELGTNLAGESCEGRVRRDEVGDPGAPPPLDIFCAGAPSASGTLYATVLPLTIPAAGEERRQAIVRAAEQSPAALEIARRMRCGPSRWVAAGENREASLAACVLADGNFPQIELVYGSDKLLYRGAGLPALLPVLARAIARDGGGAPAFGPEAASVEALSKLLDTPMAAVGSGELAQFGDLMRDARLYNGSRESGRAEAAYRRALDIETRLFGADSLGAAEVLMALALEVSNQSRFEEAAALFRRAEPIVERSANLLDRGRLSAYRALDAANRQQFGEALQLAKASTALRRGQVDKLEGPAGLGDAGTTGSQIVNRGELLHSLMIEAAMALRVDDLASAEAAATEALSLVAPTPDLPPWWRPNALAVMGEINARQGRAAIAERQLLDALAFRQRIFGESGPTALSYMALGRLYAGEDQPSQSLRAYRSAFAILEKDRRGRAEIGFDQLAPFFKSATTLAAGDAQQRPTVEAEMFRAIQLAGSGVDDQTIERASARLAAADPAIATLVRQTQEAQRRRDAARLDLASETAKPDQQRGAIKEAALVREVTSADRDVDTLSKRLEQVFPAYASLANPGPAELDAARRELRDGEAILVFEFGKSEAWGILARRDRLIAKPLDLDAERLATAVGELRRAFAPRLGTVADFDLADSYALYKKLLAPLEEGLDGVDHLIVVPGGALASLPLGVLVTRPPGPDRYAGAAWLVRRMAVSDAPSVRAFLSLREAAAARQRAPQPFLGFGNPTFVGVPPGAPSPLLALARQCRDDKPISPELLRALAPLPETAEEVTTVAHLLGAPGDAVHLGADASEATLRRQPLDQYAVLYFATHGLLPGELQCQAEPGLALSPPSAAASRAEDGLLDASEIAQLHLNADLVVLSACNTAEGGGRFGGEALSGLAEAFFHAGARGLVASHWEVPSRATMRLMTGLFADFAKDGAAAALQRAQLALLDQPATAHPFFWAAFSVIGDGGQPGAKTLTAHATAE